MQPVEHIELAGRSYATVEDLTTIYRALAVGAVLDETTGKAPQTSFAISVDRPGIEVRQVGTGGFCASGYPDKVFRSLPAGGATLHFAVEAEGFVPGMGEVDVLPTSAFPLAVPPVALRRRPVSVRGKLTTSETDTTAVFARRIDVRGRSGQYVAALRSVARRAHDAAMTVEERNVVPGASSTLAAPAGPRTRVVTVADASGFGANDTVRMGEAFEYEFALVEDVIVSRGEVVLAAPPTRSFAVGAPLAVVTVSAPAPPVASAGLARAVDPGDGLLVLDAPLAADTLELLDPTAARRELFATNVVTDAHGRYRLDGVTGVAELELQPAPPPGPPPVPPPAPPPIVTWRLDYTSPVNVVDLLTKP
jgi:hypothetical protein